MILNKLIIIATLVLLFGFFIPTNTEAAPFSWECLPSGCVSFAGEVKSLTPVPFCGLVLTVVGPNPIVGVYFGHKYRYPLLTTFPFGPAKAGDQKVLGLANLFNPNIFCPLPRITTVVGASLWRPKLGL